MKNPQPPYLSGLNEKQKEAVLHGGAPLLILAGAGSGKTRVITARIARLLDEGLFTADQVLAVTFTNKAAREMQSRIASLTGRSEGMMIRTFHSFCAWILRRNAPQAGLDPYFSIYDDEDSLALLKSIVPSGLTPGEIKTFAHLISRAKDYALTPNDDLRELSASPLFSQIYLDYERKLQAQGNVDFGGLILKTILLLREKEGIRLRMTQKFPLILVDEYQDSNLAQFELLQLLTGKQTWLSVVGDDDQSIYRFRGAEVGNILNFERTFPGTRVVKLEENYRSTGHILALAGDLVAHNSGRLGKTLWTSQGLGLKPSVVFLEDQNAEAEFCADLIIKSPQTETAILYRTNAQSRTFESVFVRRKIPYRIVGTLRFYEREEIKDMLAWLAYLANPRDEIAFRRIVNKPARGLGKTALKQVEEFLNDAGANWHEACLKALGSIKGKTRSHLESFTALVTDFRTRIGSQDLAATVAQLMEESGLLEYHRDQDEAKGSSKQENLDELLNASSPFPQGFDGLAAFLERVTLDTSTDQDAALTGTVTLITIHNTKGLEFDRVIITGLEEGLFPHSNSENDRAELEEERRLFYVGITRARRELFITTCRSRLLHGRFNYRDPSSFLGELPEDHLEIIGKKAPSKSENLFPVGCRVFQEDYGSGHVTRRWMNGDTLGVEVRFDSGRKAVFLPQFNSLERISDEI